MLLARVPQVMLLARVPQVMLLARVLDDLLLETVPGAEPPMASWQRVWKPVFEELVRQARIGPVHCTRH